MRNSKLLTNPFVIYSISFLIGLMLYPLHWSDLYPALSIELVVFLIATCLVSFIVGLLFHKVNFFPFEKVSYSVRKIWIVTIIILMAYAFEFAYTGLIPLFTVAEGAEWEYGTFGVPTFHVLVATFNPFWAVFVCHNMISSKNKSLIVAYILCALPSLLIFNRGMFLIIIVSSLFVYLMSVPTLMKVMIKMLVLALIILFLFGFAGNIRVSGGLTAHDIIEGVGDASENFKKTAIPNEFFWGYLYATSSIANLQQTINVHKIPSPSLERFAVFVNSEMVPDFISKRNSYLFKQIEPVDQISVSFTVGTLYGRSYGYFGWMGMAMLYVYVLLFNVVVLLLLNRKSVFFTTAIATLSCMMFFNTFDNMLIFSGTVLQLIFPLIFGSIERLKRSRRVKG